MANRPPLSSLICKIQSQQVFANLLHRWCWTTWRKIGKKCSNCSLNARLQIFEEKEIDLGFGKVVAPFPFQANKEAHGCKVRFSNWLEASGLQNLTNSCQASRHVIFTDNIAIMGGLSLWWILRYKATMQDIFKIYGQLPFLRCPIGHRLTRAQTMSAPSLATQTPSWPPWHILTTPLTQALKQHLSFKVY